ncbi:VirK/YbjX family protein [Candidatus Pantoea multigeneris]|uniref:DUF535 domain-containing protein n=1 Tax=Candidatus Pantoea multigeneris TaxID=2608357 RepID=A0ABX0RLG7_9GAMM|nr:VirK/YbjX family protein [Pantoea multigeneris]NIF24429.1 DUF535 domain-containing protein [Pantoea multigeneris]
MSMLTTPAAEQRTSASLFVQLLNGKVVPANHMWLSKGFRVKFALRTLAFPVSTLRYLNSLSQLPELPALLQVQGLLPVKLHRPYLRAGISVAERAEAIIHHYRTVAKIANPALRYLLQHPGDHLLAEFRGKNEEVFQIHCCPGRFDREGEATLELRFQEHLIASLSFSLVQELGVPTLLIGGLQGPRKHIYAEAVRDATKSAHGLFPKRLVMEAVFLLAKVTGAQAISAVGDDTHVFRSLRYRHSKGQHFHASYSEFWLSLGGEGRKDGMFQLPLSMTRKSLEEIASKKRAEYRRRYSLLDSLAQQVMAAAGEEYIVPASE